MSDLTLQPARGHVDVTVNAALASIVPIAALADKLGLTLALLDGHRVIWSNHSSTDSDCHSLICAGHCGDKCAVLEALHSEGPSEIEVRQGTQLLRRRIAATALGNALTLIETVDTPVPQGTDFRQLFEFSPVMLQSLDGAGCLLDVNRRWLEVMGYAREDVIGKRIDMLTTPGTANELLNVLIPQLRREGSLTNVRGQFVRASGSIIEVEASAITVRDEQGRPLNILVLDDITERLQSEERERSLHAQLVQAQKMEAVGQMAGGLAHEFNNLLTAIIGNLSLMELEGTDAPTYPQYLQDVTAAAQRSADLTRQLLLFSRKTAGTFEPVSLVDAAGQAAKLARASLPPGLELRVEVDAACPTVRGDGTLLHQVVMNLILNARDASPLGGVITVSAQEAYLAANDPRLTPPAKGGRYVLLTVSDTGEGMPDDVRQHIFEPFFTTKSAAQGTGLGLAVVYRIVQQHQGWISVESVVGKGTAFTVGLPASSEAQAPAVGHGQVVSGQGQRVLVVEDDELVLHLLCSTLEHHGYKVTTACNAAEARDELAAAAPDVLITDVQLAGENGFALLRHARSLHPQLGGLVTSGNLTEQAAKEQLASLGTGARFLSKPFRAEQLLHAVNELLAG